MGTRSRIGIWENGVVRSVYCHWDGYLSHNGKILLENYDAEKTRQLVALGDLSSLRPEIGVAHPFSVWENNDPNKSKTMTPTEFDQLYGNMTTFYSRDRGEAVNNAVEHPDFESFLDYCVESTAEYYYIMKDGVWHWGNMYGGSPKSGKLNILTANDVREEEYA